MEALAKIIALYLRITGWCLAFFVAAFLCMGVYMTFQPGSHERLRAEMHQEQSPVWFVRR